MMNDSSILEFLTYSWIKIGLFAVLVIVTWYFVKVRIFGYFKRRYDALRAQERLADDDSGAKAAVKVPGFPIVSVVAMLLLWLGAIMLTQWEIVTRRQTDISSPIVEEREQRLRSLIENADSIEHRSVETESLEEKARRMQLENQAENEAARSRFDAEVPEVGEKPDK
ncbi:MAG: hypothetical protein KDD66_04000 [Bdellovibrionales bacterium]|nr:hypothetical protein [Bdellovibrionales bacterium]